MIGIDLDGSKDVLGLWIAETESAKYWLSVLTEIRNRGVQSWSQGIHRRISFAGIR